MKSILIFEDDLTYLTMMELILRKEGFEVRCAPDGESGIAMAREQLPDLVLCDIMMPDMNGHMVLEKLRTDPALAKVPFIFVTSKGERADVRRGMSEGADDYLPKPFSANELLEAIRTRIHRQNQILQKGSTDEQSILLKKITRREREVLLLVGEALTSREIAKTLGTTVKTIEAHRSNLMRKLGAANSTALAKWALFADQID